MEIRIDERLVDVFNEVVEKDNKTFNGEKNLEKAINSHLAGFFCFIDDKNNNEILSKEVSDKLLDFLSDDLENSDANIDATERGLALLAKAFLANASK